MIKLSSLIVLSISTIFYSYSASSVEEIKIEKKITNNTLTKNCIKLLVFTKTASFRHKSIPKGIKAIEKLALNNKWKIKATEDASVFTEKKLKKFDALVFLNTTGDILNKGQQEAFEQYIQNGGGFVGIHSASDTEHHWPFYAEMIGAQFKNHPAIQDAKINVNQENQHSSTSHLGITFNHKDEWYNFKKPVADYVNVLLDLDESSYKGPQMGGYHPIAWYHEFKGGKVFYTGMGHTNEAYDSPQFIQHLKEGILWSGGQKNKAISSKKITKMFDKNLSKWETFMGIPHSSVQGLPKDVKTSENVHEGTPPMGLNKDIKKVFSVNDKGELHITGEIYGGLSTIKEYENYHLSVQFKWGEKKWKPRLNEKRDSGLLYHAKGAHGAFWNVWKSSLEFQVQEGDCGDFIALGDVFGDVPSDKTGKGFVFNPKGKNNHLKWKLYGTGRVKKKPLNEKPNGEWNTLEIYTIGDKSIHLVNGVIVNAVVNARQGENEDVAIPVTKGQIQIQSEGAELFYRNMTIEENISDFSKEHKAFMGWN